MIIRVNSDGSVPALAGGFAQADENGKPCCCGCDCFYTGAAVHFTCEGGCYTLVNGVVAISASGSGTITGVGNGDQISVSYEWSVSMSVNLTQIGFAAQWTHAYMGGAGPISITGDASAEATMIENIGGPGVLGTEPTDVVLSGNVTFAPSVIQIVASVSRGYGLDTPEWYTPITAGGSIALFIPLDEYAMRELLANGGSLAFSESTDDATLDIGSGAGPNDWAIIDSNTTTTSGSASGTYSGVTTPLPSDPYESLPRAINVAGTYDGKSFSARLALIARPNCATFGELNPFRYAGTGLYDGDAFPCFLTATVGNTDDTFVVWAFGIGTVALWWRQSSLTPESPTTVYSSIYGAPSDGSSVSIVETPCLQTDPIQSCRPCVLCTQCPAGPETVTATFDYGLGSTAPEDQITYVIEGYKENDNPCNYEMNGVDLYGYVQAEGPGVDEYGVNHGHRMRYRIFRMLDSIQIFDGAKNCRNDGTPEITGIYQTIPLAGLNSGPINVVIE